MRGISGLHGFFGNRKVKRRAAVHCAFRPGSSAVAMNDALDARQTNAGPLELLLAVQPLKHAEQFFGILRIETDAVVANEDYRLAVTTGPSPRRSVLHGLLCWHRVRLRLLV